jgi:hypothetical protein
MEKIMKAKEIGLCLTLALLLVATNPLQGALVAPQSIVAVEKAADLIVNGTASGFVRNGSRFDFSLQVNRVIKGDGTLAGSSIGAYWLSVNQPATGSVGGKDIGSPGIWFLRRTSGPWQVVPLVQGSMQLSNIYIPSPPGPVLSAYAYSASASLDDKLASEMCSAIEGVGGDSLQMYALLIGGVDELNSSVPHLFYRRLVNSSSTEKQVFGLSGLIRSGDSSALTAAAQIASTVTGRHAEGALLLSVREYLRPTDPTSVIAVGQVATNSTVPAALREVAAHVLEAVHTAAALPFLATLLDDPDLNLRVEAVGGMGAFANGLAVRTRQTQVTLVYLQLPANAPYKTQDTVAHFALGRQTIAANEASYISFWKAWWSANRASLGY